MNKIEAFNVAIAEIFGQCYREFPLRVSISKMDIGITIKEAFGSDPGSHIDLSEKEYQIAEQAMEWLIQADYPWCTNSGHPITFEGVTLSPKGLEALNATPSELKTKTTLGDSLSKGLKSLGKDAASTAVKQVLTYGTKLAIGL